ncbi:hypothetical protein INR77_03960 [Erythrobacter sp. SCSIO 43205]|uniref:hypothetical protein n=1 Tax=Erythrobacter sp. SCSIO 43205 TaxID=2779361 RepID=UPI001CA7FD81|nr:hypothetical protein [Erythrobacter sp. SCSIO 43205]UAB78871.1 hypothetical protein INR77_03960 [Erythrobacter sp. SCSIO 43205]
MKRITLAAVSLTALITPASVLAQADVTINQTGLDHSVSIGQVEDVLNSITVTQAQNEQSAQIRQTAPGGSNTAVTSQGEVGGIGQNAIELRQTGSNNNGSITQNSSTNIMLATQDGSGNTLTTNQGFVDGTGADGVGNNILARQNGDDNIITVRQNFDVLGSGNDVDIFQDSNNNEVTIDQEGSTNTAFVVQGDIAGVGMNQATITQIGSGNLTAIGQNSTGNVAVGTQTGNNNQLFIDQGFNNGTGVGGDGNYAEGIQNGNNNTLEITQNVTTSGSGNSAIIRQIGDGFDLIINQEGSGMTVDMTQM